MDRYKSNYINNSITCDWIKRLNQKTGIVQSRLLKIPKRKYILSTGYTNKLKVRNTGKGYIMQTVTMGELKWLYVRQNKL